MKPANMKKHHLGYWEIANKPSLKELEEYYSEKYYQEAKGSYELEYSEKELAYFNAKLAQRYAVLCRNAKYVKGAQYKILDVGCGEGFTLKFFKDIGWSVRGIDFSSAGVSLKNPDCIESLITGDVFSLIMSEISAGNKYDVIWLQNVLEHVIEPIDLLKSIKSLVKDGGIAVVTVPNDFSSTQMTAIKAGHIDHPFWVAPPDHLSYFDNSSLKNIANHCGWKCIEMLGDFPIDWFLFHPSSNYIRDKEQGKAAHLARIQVENLISQQPIEDVVDFWSSLAKIGLGRDITAFLRPTVTI